MKVRIKAKQILKEACGLRPYSIIQNIKKIIFVATLLLLRTLYLLQPGNAETPKKSRHQLKIENFMKTNEKGKLSLDDLKLESFVTSIDSEMAIRLAGGLSAASHPGHTDPTDNQDTPRAQCTTMICQ